MFITSRGNMAAETPTTVMFVCKRCGHDTKTKGNLIQHLKKQKACPDTFSKESRESLIKSMTRVSDKPKIHGCSYCDQMFSFLQGKHQHMKICPKNPQNELIAKVNSMEKIIEQLQNQLVERAHSTYNNTVIQSQQNNSINIILNNYGNETTPQLTHEFLNSCLLNPTKGLPSLIEKIHYSSELPENHNLRHKSTKQNLFQKFIDSNWHDCDASNTLDELIKKGYRILSTYYTDHVANDPTIIEDEIKARIYEKFRFLGDKKSLEYNAVKRDLRLLVKDKTIFLLASDGTSINPDELEQIESEIEGALASV